jgi:hypothetical protein
MHEYGIHRLSTCAIARRAIVVGTPTVGLARGSQCARVVTSSGLIACAFTTGEPAARRTDCRQGDGNKMNVALATDSRAAALAVVTPIGIFQRRHPTAVAHKGSPS